MMPIIEHLYKSALALFLCFLFVPKIHVSATSKPLKDLQIFDQKDGLSSNMTFKTVRDSKGFIWIATTGGLNRYDGKSFKYYKVEDRVTGGASDVIRSLAIDSDDNLWIGTKGQGLFFYNRKSEVFTQYKNVADDPNSLSHNEVLCILPDSKGRIWIGTEEKLNLFQNGEFIRYSFQVGEEDLDRNPVVTLYEDTSENLWVGLWGGGLNVLINKNADPTEFEFKNISSLGNGALDNGNVWSIIEDINGRLWIGAFQGGLFFTNEKISSIEDISPDLTFSKVDSYTELLLSEIFCFSISPDNRLFIGASNGISSIDLSNPNVYKNIELEDLASKDIDGFSFPDNEIRDLSFDEYGLLWVSSFGGVFLVDFGLPKLSLSTIDLNGDNQYITDILPIDSLGYYISTTDGLIYNDTKKGTYKKYRFNHPSSTDYNQVLAMYHHHSSSRIYLSTKKGLTSFNTKSEQFKIHPIISKSDFKSKTVRKFLPTEDPDQIYLASLEGLLRIELPNEILVQYEADILDSNKLSNNQVTEIIENDGVLYVATHGGGLNVIKPFDNGEYHLKRYLYNANVGSAIPDNLLTSLSFNKDKSIIWIGSDYGLIRFDINREQFSTIDGIKNSRISGLAVDAIDRVWYTSPEGIFCYDPKNNRISKFSEKDNSQLNRYTYAAHKKLKDGRIFFGAKNAYHLFRGEDILFDTISAKVIFTDLSIGGESITTASIGKSKRGRILDDEIMNVNSISLAHNDFMIKLDFALTGDYGSDYLEYRYRLVGLSDQWKSNFSGHVEFSSLPNGEYILEIMAKNEHGFWSEVTKLDIYVSPPFYKSPWFVGFMSCVVLGISYGYASRRIQIVNRSKKELESAVIKGANKLSFLHGKQDSKVTPDLIKQVLNDNEAFYTQLYLESPLGILITDENANILRSNRRAQAFIDEIGLFKSSKDVYKNIDNTSDLLEVFQRIKGIIDNKTDYFREDVMYKFKDEIYWFDCAISIIRNEIGEVKNAIISIDDISERKVQENLINELLDELEIKNSGLESTIAQRNKKLEETNKELKFKNEELERFAFIASHDLKEPVRNINSYLTLIKMKMGDQLNEDVKEYFNRVSESTSVMYELISDVLEYSRINKEDDKMDRVDLSTVMTRVTSMIENNLKEKNAQVIFEDLHVVNSNGSFLFVVLKNIIENGLKFNISTQPVIRVSSEYSEDGLKIKVSDNGIGIPLEYQSQIFEMFQRLHNKSEFTGSGLGLSICKRIMERLDGSISVESQENEGSTFVLSLPQKAIIEITEKTIS